MGATQFAAETHCNTIKIRLMRKVKEKVAQDICYDRWNVIYLIINIVIFVYILD